MDSGKRMTGNSSMKGKQCDLYKLKFGPGLVCSTNAAHTPRVESTPLGKALLIYFDQPLRGYSTALNVLTREAEETSEHGIVVRNELMSISVT